MFVAYSSDSTGCGWIDGLGETAESAIAEAVSATGADPEDFDAVPATPALVDALMGPKGGQTPWTIIGGVADVRPEE